MLFVNRKTRQIIAVAQAKGKTHGFKIYKTMVGSNVLEEIKLQGDSGFQGLLEIHKNSEIPKKKSKHHPFSTAEKLENKRISQERVLVENVIAKVKVFKILTNRYRNRRKRYNLRMSLICGIYNEELKT